MKIIISLLLSILFHAWLLYSIATPHPPPLSGSSGPPPQAPPAVHVKIHIIEKSGSIKKDECKNFYYGIGITTQRVNNTNIVSQTFRGYPGHTAGLLAGDIITSPTNLLQIQGPMGTIVKIIIMREERLLSFNITRDKICGVLKDK